MTLHTREQIDYKFEFGENNLLEQTIGMSQHAQCTRWPALRAGLSPRVYQ